MKSVFAIVAVSLFVGSAQASRLLCYEISGKNETPTFKEVVVNIMVDEHDSDTLRSQHLIAKTAAGSVTVIVNNKARQLVIAYSAKNGDFGVGATGSFETTSLVIRSPDLDKKIEVGCSIKD